MLLFASILSCILITVGYMGYNSHYEGTQTHFEGISAYSQNKTTLTSRGLESLSKVEDDNQE